MKLACYFCSLFRLRQDIVWEGEAFFSVFDNHPVSCGHMLVIPKRHIVDFKEVSKIEWNGLKEGIEKSIKAIENADLKSLYDKFIKEHESVKSVFFCKRALKKTGQKPQAYNHGFNDGKVAGRTVDHFHWHIIPRFEGDIKDSNGGVRFVIPEMGNYR